MAGGKPGRAKQDLVRFTVNLRRETLAYVGNSAQEANLTKTNVIEDAIAKRQFLETVSSECGFVESYDAEGVKVRYITDPAKYAAFAVSGVLRATNPAPASAS